MLGVLKRYFTQHNSNIGQLPTLLGHQLPVVRANMTDSFANALGLGSVGSFLAGVASRLKAVSAHLEHPATQHAAAFPLQVEPPPSVEQHVVAEKNGRKPWMWVAGAAALALFAALAARGCSTEKADHDAAADTQADAGASNASSDAAVASASAVTLAASAPGASAPALLPANDAVMNVNVDASGVPTIKATVSTEQERQRLIDALSAKLGADKFHADISVDPDTKPAGWLDKLDLLMPIMTQPGAELRVAGDSIDLSGSASEAKFGWLDKLRSLFGKGWKIGLGTAAAADASATASAPAEASVAAAASAPVVAGGECDAGVIARKLNLKPVNFRFGSNTAPQAALNELAKTAQVLKSCSTAATPIKLQIGGFSDNTGSKAVNLALSKQRAESVRSFMVKHGVPASALVVRGFGDASPIADNKTPAGRMANRRVEFSAAN
ncbi:OmpA family protein [Candidatus Burkholderia verschuerenii]|uniref:OmpA family protein n=1 Tax=Candidatus Burkholderia verschuerenii TaxID=242163 RepID=UPI001E35CFD0|nr:OmpA family protein [Candidatus Burkholderia verschuerenii]